jgi:hypothetical protein
MDRDLRLVAPHHFQVAPVPGEGEEEALSAAAWHKVGHAAFSPATWAAGRATGLTRPAPTCKSIEAERERERERGEAVAADREMARKAAEADTAEAALAAVAARADAAQRRAGAVEAVALGLERDLAKTEEWAGRQRPVARGLAPPPARAVLYDRAYDRDG